MKSSFQLDRLYLVLIFGLLAGGGQWSTAQAEIHRLEPSARYEVAFSPAGGAEELVLKVINSAKVEIRVMAYAFTSVEVTRALLAALHRGIDVALVVDHKQNLLLDKGKAKAALAALALAGASVRTIKRYDIHHDKVIVIDRVTVQTGSYNYSQAAARRNSENVLVVWQDTQLAGIYLNHWRSRYDQGENHVPIR